MVNQGDTSESYTKDADEIVSSDIYNGHECITGLGGLFWSNQVAASTLYHSQLTRNPGKIGFLPSLPSSVFLFCFVFKSAYVIQ